LCYLHPDYFAPDPSIYSFLGISKDDKYAIFRFVAWHATHDIGTRGLSVQMKKKLATQISKQAKVFISSEGALPDDLKQYQIKIPPEKMHDALAYASLFIGEGGTMVSECAMLGTPSIYVNTFTPGTVQDQEKYGLIFSYKSSEGVLEKGREILENPNTLNWQEMRNRMLSEKIDVTAFMVWLIENYPESFQIMKENPDHQYKFM